MCNCKELTIPVGPAGPASEIEVSDANGNTVSNVTDLRFLNKTITVTDLGSGIATVENIRYKAEIKNYATIVYNTLTTETTLSGFTYTTPNDGITRSYLLMFRADIFSNIASVLTELRIRNLTTTAILAISTPETPDSSGSGSYVGDSIHCYVSLAPNTQIGVTFQTPNILIGLKYPHLIILEQ